MKCEKCGKIMVPIDEGRVNCSLPPSIWMRCICGNVALERLGTWEPPKTFEERWEEANGR